MRQQFEFQVHAPIDNVVETYLKTEFFIASMERAGARSVALIESSDLPDGSRRWKAKITEAARLPQFLKTSDILIIVNESVFSPSERRLTFNIRPASAAIPIRLDGTIRLFDAGDDTRLQYDVKLSIKLPLINRKTEMLGLKVVGDECQKQAALLDEWARSIGI